MERINVNYEEITTYSLNNTIEYVLVYPQSKVRDTFCGYVEICFVDFDGSHKKGQLSYILLEV